MSDRSSQDYMHEFTEQISQAERMEERGDYLNASHLYHSIGDQLLSNYADKENSAIYFKRASECLAESRS